MDSICSCINNSNEESCLNTLEKLKSITNASIKTNFLYIMIQTPSFHDKIKEFYIKKLDLKCNTSDFSDFFFKKYDKLKDDQKSLIFNDFVDSFKQDLVKCLFDMISYSKKNGHFIACVNRLAGDYLLSLDPVHSLRKIAFHFKNALDLEPTRPKLWRKWAYVNSALFSESKVAHKSRSTISSNEAMINQQNQDRYANNSIRAFLKLTELVPNDSLEFASQILSILSASSELVTSQFINLNLLPSAVINVLPLITSKLDHPDKNVNLIIERLLISSSMRYFKRFILHLICTFYQMMKNQSLHNQLLIK